MSEMLTFDGKIAEFSGDFVTLEARDANGSLRLASTEVVIASGRVQVRKGARLSGIQEPHRADITFRPTAERLADRCDGGITACIGGLLVCASDLHVIGTCQGAWGAAKVFTP